MKSEVWVSYSLSETLFKYPLFCSDIQFINNYSTKQRITLHYENISLRAFINESRLLAFPVWTSYEVDTFPGRRSWDWGFWPLKICRRGQSMFWPPKMSHYFINICCWITASFKSSRMKVLCQKWKVKVILEVPETVWWLDLTDPDPIFFQGSTPLQLPQYALLFTTVITNPTLWALIVQHKRQRWSDWTDLLRRNIERHGP